jgi:prepilin-type N-terminal cleavage/methylation domain-containing protein
LEGPVKPLRPPVEYTNGFCIEQGVFLGPRKPKGVIMNRQTQEQIRTRRGFTLVEIIIVVVILAIASLVAIPVFSTGADMQVRSAANKIAADMDYAKGLAVTHQKNYTVVFTPASESYQIQDADGNVIDHPLRSGQFIETLSADRRVGRVNIVSTNFNNDAVTFDYLGAPYSGTDTSSPLNSGRIILQADAFTLNVDIEPVTGYVTITP